MAKMTFVKITLVEWHYSFYFYFFGCFFGGVNNHIFFSAKINFKKPDAGFDIAYSKFCVFNHACLVPWDVTKGTIDCASAWSKRAIVDLATKKKKMSMVDGYWQ